MFYHIELSKLYKDLNWLRNVLSRNGYRDSCGNWRVKPSCWDRIDGFEKITGKGLVKQILEKEAEISKLEEIASC